MRPLTQLAAASLFFTVAAAAVAAAPASAITIAGARVAKGAVQVKGRDAAPFALITWEGRPLVQAKRNGRFRFETAILPADCVGELADGVEVVRVVVESCGPQGPPGDPGPQGLQGQLGPGLVVKDASNVVIGTVVDRNAQTSAVTIAMSRNGRPLALTLDKNGAFEDYPSSLSLQFESSDCSGEPVKAADQFQGLLPTALVRNKIAYVPSGAPSVRTIGSSLDFVIFDPTSCTDGVFTPPDRCCHASAGESVEVVALGTFDLSALGVPPLHVEAP